MTRSRRPGEIRDAIQTHLAANGEATISELLASIRERFGSVTPSSVRSSLNLLEGDLFERTRRGHYRLKVK